MFPSLRPTNSADSRPFTSPLYLVSSLEYPEVFPPSFLVPDFLSESSHPFFETFLLDPSPLQISELRFPPFSAFSLCSLL